MKRFATYSSVFGITAFALWYAMQGGEVGQVKRFVENARSTVSWTSKESQLQLLADINRLNSCLSRDVQVKIDVVGGIKGVLDGADEVRGAVLAARQHLPNLEVRILDINVTLTDPKHARVELTANFASEKPKEINPQEFLLLLHKNEGSWYIDKLETVRTLQSQ